MTRTSLPGAAVVAVVKRCAASRDAKARRSSVARSTPGRHAEVSDGRQREDGKQERAPGGSTPGARSATPSRRIQPHGREERHVHVVEHEDLVAQDRQAVEVQRALLVGDRGDRRLQAGDVRLERDRDPVAEAALHARAERSQEPGGRRRHAEAEGGRHQQAPVAAEDALPQELQPEGEQARPAGRRAATSANEAAISRGSWRIAELQHPPHRGQGRRAGRLRRGVIGRSLLVRLGREALGLQLEHRAVAPAQGHQLVVGAELDHAAVLEHADAVRVAHGREAVRDQDGGDARGWRRGSGRRSRPRRARRAARSARRAAPGPRRGARRTAPGRARPAATGRPRGRCRRRSRGPGACRETARPSAPASASAARTASSGAPPGATLSRSGSSKRTKSWKTAARRERQASSSRSRRSTPSTSIAPPCGS